MLLSVGAAAGALLAVGAVVAVIVRSRPVRWVGRKLVHEPLSRWFQAQITYVVEPQLAEIRAELRPNGGTSLRDRVDRIESKVDTIGVDTAGPVDVTVVPDGKVQVQIGRGQADPTAPDA